MLTLLESRRFVISSFYPTDTGAKQQACVLPQPIHNYQLMWRLFSCALFVGLKETFGL